MHNNIDLGKYEVRTDLVLEQIPKENHIKKEEKKENGIITTTITIDKNSKDLIRKKEGTYITIEFDDITNFESREEVGKIVVRELKKVLKLKNIKESDECLIIGLGNRNSTPDSLGPLTLDNIIVTRHLFELGTSVKNGIRNVSKISPGVMGDTGIETSNYVKSIIDLIKPQFVIVIDALAASSLTRLNKTLQITDTGISPGSGIGNSRKELSQETLGIPVIAIGIPTVVESVTIVNDTINNLFTHISYLKENTSKSKLEIFHKKKEDNLTKEEKKELIGMLGTLEEDLRKKLIFEVLTTSNHNLIVTTKEIDFLIEKLSDLISSAVNNALHKEITHY